MSRIRPVVLIAVNPDPISAETGGRYLISSKHRVLSDSRLELSPEGIVEQRENEVLQSVASNH